MEFTQKLMCEIANIEMGNYSDTPPNYVTSSSELPHSLLLRCTEACLIDVHNLRALSLYSDCGTGTVLYVRRTSAAW